MVVLAKKTLTCTPENRRRPAIAQEEDEKQCMEERPVKGND